MRLHQICAQCKSSNDRWMSDAAFTKSWPEHGVCLVVGQERRAAMSQMQAPGTLAPDSAGGRGPML